MVGADIHERHESGEELPRWGVRQPDETPLNPASGGPLVTAMEGGDESEDSRWAYVGSAAGHAAFAAAESTDASGTDAGDVARDTPASDRTAPEDTSDTPAEAGGGGDRGDKPPDLPPTGGAELGDGDNEPYPIALDPGEIAHFKEGEWHEGPNAEYHNPDFPRIAYAPAGTAVVGRVGFDQMVLNGSSEGCGIVTLWNGQEGGLIRVQGGLVHVGAEDAGTTVGEELIDQVTTAIPAFTDPRTVAHVFGGEASLSDWNERLAAKLRSKGITNVTVVDSRVTNDVYLHVENGTVQSFAPDETVVYDSGEGITIHREITPKRPGKPPVFERRWKGGEIRPALRKVVEMFQANGIDAAGVFADDPEVRSMLPALLDPSLTGRQIAKMAGIIPTKVSYLSAIAINELHRAAPAEIRAQFPTPTGPFLRLALRIEARHETDEPRVEAVGEIAGESPAGTFYANSLHDVADAASTSWLGSRREEVAESLRGVKSVYYQVKQRWSDRTRVDADVSYSLLNSLVSGGRQGAQELITLIGQADPIIQDLRIGGDDSYVRLLLASRLGTAITAVERQLAAAPRRHEQMDEIELMNETLRNRKAQLEALIGRLFQ